MLFEIVDADGDGQISMEEIQAQYEAEKEALHDKLEDMPYFASIDESENTRHQEPDRFIFNVGVEAASAEEAEAITRKSYAAFADKLEKEHPDFQFDAQICHEQHFVCASCGKQSLAEECRGDRRKKFGGLVPCPCRVVHYCDAACQSAHWKVHKKTCTARKKV